MKKIEKLSGITAQTNLNPISCVINKLNELIDEINESELRRQDQIERLVKRRKELEDRFSSLESTTSESETGEDILGCPWCGNIPTVKSHYHEGWIITCMNEKCKVRPHIPTAIGHNNCHSREEAVRNWNRRAK
jgi:hypothetical protein